MRRPGERAVLWAAVAVAAASVVLAAGPLAWRFAGESGLPPPAPVPSRDAAAVSIEPILALSPFGRTVSADGAPPAEETSLGLTLHGVVIATPPEASTAIVSTATDPARVYSVGDQIAGTAALDAVFPDHLILRVDGHPETLSFPEHTGTPAPSPAATGDPAEPQPDADTLVADYRQRFQENPQEVIDGLGLMQSDAGYEVSEGAPQVVLGAGLQPGDVIDKVNGQQVGNIVADRRLFDDVLASGHARIEVLRAGQPIVLSFPLK